LVLEACAVRGLDRTATSQRDRTVEVRFGGEADDGEAIERLTGRREQLVNRRSGATNQTQDSPAVLVRRRDVDAVDRREQVRVVPRDDVGFPAQRRIRRSGRRGRESARRARGGLLFAIPEGDRDV